MRKYLHFICGLGIMAGAGQVGAEALVIDHDTDTCRLFEALNGPENMPENCRPEQPRTRGISVKPAAAPHYDRAMLPEISFEYDSDELSPAARRELDKVVAVMTAPQSAKQHYRIEGNTDNQGSEAYNRQLSRSRAEAVRQYLIERGVPDAKLTAVGNGFHNLLDPVHPDNARNRRVEFLNQSLKAK